MCPLQDVKPSGFEAVLLVDPVNDIAIRGVAADGFAQDLADASVIVMINGNQQLPQTAVEHIPGQMIFVGRHEVAATLSPISNSS